MSDQVEGPRRPDADRALGALDCSRLEEVGDLHAQASAFSSALEYYGRLLEESALRRQPPARSLLILRKSVDAALSIGDLTLADSLLTSANGLLDSAADLSTEARSHLVAPLMARRASLLVQRGAHMEALHLAKHAFAILAVTDEHREVANLQVTMGICHQRLGRLDKAEEFYGDALATYRRVGDELGAAALYNNLSLLHKTACRWNRALELLEKAVAIAKRHGATHLLSRLHLNQGILLCKTGRLAEARVEFERSLRLSRSLGDRNRQAKTCLAFGWLEILSGRLARAEELVQEGRLLADREGFQREATIADEYLGDILLARGDVVQALYSYSLGLEKSRAIGRVNDLEGEILRRIAEAQRIQGSLDQAIETGLAAIAVCEKCGEQYELGFCHRTLAQALAALGSPERADTHFRRSIAVFRQQNLSSHWAESILAFVDARLTTAAQPELLLLKRLLAEVQESGVAVITDRLLACVQQSLAEVQLRLGQFDDALLSLYELERSAAVIGDASLNVTVTDLRSRIERGLLGELESTESHLHAISGIPGIFSWSDSTVPRNLASVLKAGLERVHADHGFIALEYAGSVDSPQRIVAREALSENLAQQLSRWYRAHLGDGDAASPCLFSRMSDGDALLQAVPAARGKIRSCVFMPIALAGKRFGLLFLGKEELRGADGGFGKPALDFLATYMGFLALFLFEKGRGRLPGEASQLPTPIENVASFENIITEHEAMLEVLGLVRKVAPSSLTVLLSGETGTGKGLLAYTIHALSRRSDRRFLSINCAAIPETLLESELFGHVKGSFTGAIGDKRGLLAEAEGGTVFLDEIGKMPLSMQGKLLHFLDTKVIRPVGSNQDRRVDVRIVCATKHDLHVLSDKGLFLEDLYYRLLDFPITVPPLRERRDDIQLLTHHFIERFAHESGLAIPGYTAEFMAALLQHDWPGNVRELEKCIRRAIVLAQDERVLKMEHLPPVIGSRPSGSSTLVGPLRDALASVECREITRVLRLTNGNKSEASRLLEISYPNLLKKIRYYGIR